MNTGKGEAFTADAARVADILRDARRGDRDPDLSLFEGLIEFDQGSTTIEDLLTRLVRDAD